VRLALGAVEGFRGALNASGRVGTGTSSVVSAVPLPHCPPLAAYTFTRFIYKGNTSTHAQGTDPRVALGA